MCRIIESIEPLAIDINDMPWQVYDEVDWIKIMTNINIGVSTSNSSIIFKSSSDSHSYPHLPDKSSGP